MIVHRSIGRLWHLCALALVALLITGCATPPPPQDAEAVAEFNQVNDPAEPTMRAIFEVNLFLDKLLLKPVAELYRGMIPPPVQRSIHNALNNLRSPVIFFNDLLQGEVERAGVTLARFAINSTIGILGIRDQASEFGLDFHNEDFGQTLAVWNTPEGPYLMLPIFGPSNPRDAIGLVVDYLVDPFNWWADDTDREWAIYTRTGLRSVSERARNFDVLEDLEKSSLDYYAAIRSLYRQRRIDEINNGETSANMPAPGISEDHPLLPPADSGGLSRVQ